jgi:predicted transport protein
MAGNPENLKNPLLKKLRIQPGQHIAILNAPEEYRASLGELPEGVTVSEQARGRFDLVHLFVSSSTELARLGPVAMNAVKPDGLLWISYPKTTSGVKTDLTRDAGWKIIEDAGWRGIAQVAIDETWSATRFRPDERKTGTEAIDAQYSGGKAALRPVYERLYAIVTGFGNDVEIGVRNTYVAFSRGRQFALVRPASRHVDVGLKLCDVSPGGRLETAHNVGSGSMTHKVTVSSLNEVDDELISWLRQAYHAT